MPPAQEKGSRGKPPPPFRSSASRPSATVREDYQEKAVSELSGGIQVKAGLLSLYHLSAAKRVGRIH